MCGLHVSVARAMAASGARWLSGTFATSTCLFAALWKVLQSSSQIHRSLTGGIKSTPAYRVVVPDHQTTWAGRQVQQLNAGVDFILPPPPPIQGL
jgi:hypothetical protein